ncbi:hypothetical protein BGZ81_009534 [Podila clonocystis]|nr:hypothetical protein BGZ81_009534 [Podila clonocystis]
MNNSNSAAGSAQGNAESETQNSTLHGDGSSIRSTTTHDTAAQTLLNKPVPGPQESYSPWDMPPIIQPATSNADTRPSAGCKGFATLNTTWPHFRSKPHPTISVPATPTTLTGRSNFDMAAPSTPPHSSFSNPEDSDNAMVTPTFGSSNSGYSRRNSAISVMALDTPPPLSLMDLESSSGSSLSGSSFGSSGLGHGLPGPSMRPSDSGFNGNGHGYPFPLFGMRNDVSYSISRRSSRTNSVSMESRHVRKPSEDTNMSDGGNNSGSERGRRHSPAVVPFERSVRRSALLPKPKGLLKVFTQLEEEAHHNRHEYDHERETTQVRKGATEGSDVTLMDATVGNGRRSPFPLEASVSRRPSSSRLNPDQELCNFQRQQEEYDKLYQMQQLQHLAQLQEQQQLEREHQQSHPHPLQATVHLEQHPIEAQSGSTSSMSHHHNNASMMSSPSSPLLAPMVTRSSKRKSSTCEERFEPYNSSHLKRRAVSPSLGPIISHRRSPSSSPARSHLAGHPKSKQAMMGPLSSPSGHGSIFRQHGSNLSIGSGMVQEVDDTTQSGRTGGLENGHAESATGHA